MRESGSLLELSRSLSIELGSSESSSNGSGLLGSKILGDVLLALIQLSELLTLSVVDDGQDASNRLSDLVQLGRLDVAVRSVLDAELVELLLEALEFFLELSLGFVLEFSSLRVGL